jgi:hypothetical protein
MTIDTQDIGIKTFSLSPCGHYIGKSKILFSPLLIRDNNPTYIGMVNDSGTCMISKLTYSEGMNTLIGYDTVTQVTDAVPLTIVRADTNKVIMHKYS